MLPLPGPNNNWWLCSERARSTHAQVHIWWFSSHLKSKSSVRGDLIVHKLRIPMVLTYYNWYKRWNFHGTGHSLPIPCPRCFANSLSISIHKSAVANITGVCVERKSSISPSQQRQFHKNISAYEGTHLHCVSYESISRVSQCTVEESFGRRILYNRRALQYFAKTGRLFVIQDIWSQQTFKAAQKLPQRGAWVRRRKRTE